jgi:anti-sigma-K factor RskA
MSDVASTRPQDGAQVTAAEYVLGVVGAAERRAAENLLSRDQAFAAEVVFWEERLAPLADAVAPVPPPEDGWARIAKAARIRMPADPQVKMQRSLAFWRSFGIGAAVLAAASIGVLTFIVTSPPAPPPPPARVPLLAILAEGGDQPRLVVAAGSDGRSLVVVPVSLPSTEQQAIELWLVPPGGRPSPIALIEPEVAARIDLPPELAARLAPNVGLELSIEPAGGSPSEQPSGAKIATGKLTPF